MLGIITLLAAFAAQITLFVYRAVTKSWQLTATYALRIATFAAFSLLLVAGVYWWGFRWMGLFFLLALLAFISVVRMVRKNKEKRFGMVSAVFSCLGGIVLLTICTMPGILFPQFRQIMPTGSLRIDTESVTFVDKSRIDPFSEKNEYRKLTVQFWYPANEAQGKRYPLVVFSHGAFGFRGSNLTTFEELASNGYVVCSIDHSNHSFFARHADDSYTVVNFDFLNDAINITNGKYDEKTAYDKTHEWLALRTSDMDFVLDEILLNDGSVPQAIKALIDSDKIGLFGHSLGGATAAEMGRMRADIDAVAVIDGTMFGEEIAFENGSAVLTDVPYPIPLLNFYNEDHYEDAQALGTAYDNLSASVNAAKAYDVVIRESGHLNFTDLPLFSPTLASMLGTGDVDSRYCIETMNEVVLAFFNHVLKDAEGLELQKEY